MALVAHYPLNHDNKNYGISNVPYDDTGTTFIKGGKIGKCYYQKRTGVQPSYYMEELDGARQFSFGMWINFDKDNTNWSKAITLGTKKSDGSNGDIIRMENAYTSDATKSQFGIYNSSNYSILEVNLGACGVKTLCEEWHHFMFTTDGILCRFYKDGIKIGECNNIGGYLSGYVYFGSSNANTGNCNCKLNDIRIYNHCLSDSEIKEIYKTPILRYSFDYPLADPVISTASNPNMTWGVVTNNCALMGRIIYDKEYVIDNQCFTISFDIEIKDIVGVDGAKAAMTIQDNTILNGETSSKWSTIITASSEIYGKAPQFASNDGTREIDLRKNGIYHICRTYRITNTSRFKHNWSIQIRTDNITGGIAKISNFRVVLGEKEIPYDGTNGIVYDESGMGNNGLLTVDNKSLKTIYSTDAKIGEGCYVCDTADVDGTIKYSVVETENNFDELNELTISFWVYLNKINRTDVVDATFLAQSKDPTKYSIWIRYNPQTLKLSSTLYGSQTNMQSILKEEEWIFITITANKDSNQKIYINGELKDTGTIVNPSDWDETKLTITDLRKGRRLRFDGKIDDLRIYATELDADEIKKMYKERARVDSKGNLYCNELVESPYKIDYIRSDGNQYIDTEIIGDYDIKIEIKVGSLEAPNTFSALYGSRINSTNQFWAYIDSTVDDSIYIRRLTNGYRIQDFNWNSTHIIIQDKNGVTVDGEKKLTYTTMSKFPNPQNLYLFNVDNNQQPQSNYGIRMNLYYCKIWKNNEIVRDFIPAISNEVGHINEVCLYDLVTNRYFYNLSGVGEFVMNEPHLDMLATDEVKINEKGIVNCAILNEGKSIAKIIHKNSIFETNQINEN